MGCHPLCDLIGGTCSLATHRTRGCRPNLTARETAPAVLAEAKELLLVIDPASRGDATRVAATRLASLIRRETLEERNLLAAFTSEEPALAPALARLCARHEPGRPDRGPA